MQKYNNIRPQPCAFYFEPYIEGSPLLCPIVFPPESYISAVNTHAHAHVFPNYRYV